MRAILADRRFPVDELRYFASARSVGRTLPWNGEEIAVEVADARLVHSFGPLAADNVAIRVGDEVEIVGRKQRQVDAAVAEHLDNEAFLLAGLTRAERRTLDELLRKLLASRGLAKEFWQ